MTVGAAPATPGPVLTRHPVKRHAGPVTSRRVPQQPRPRRDLPPLPPLPAWAHDLPEPATYLRAGWRKLHDGVNDGQDRVLVGAVVIGAWYALTAQPWMPALLTAAAWLTALGYGLATLGLCHAGAAPWQWTTRRAAVALGAVVVLGLLLLVSGALFAAFLLSLGVAQGFAHRPASQREVKWWSHEKIANAFVIAKILTLENGALPTIGYLGKPKTDEHGTWVTFRLPPGNTWQQVRKKQDELASALGLRADRLHVEHDPSQEAGAVTVGVAHLRDGKPRAAVIPDRTVWSEPFRVGQDARGRELRLETFGTNDLFGGIPNSGKTTAVRLQLAHYLLDPRTTLFGADGKGSRKDYGRPAALARRWVWGTSLDAAPELLVLLREVLAVIQWRNERSDNEPAGGWPGVLVLLEELQEIRAGADDKQTEELDVLLGRCIRLGRAVNVKILVSTQRPVKEDVPSGVRNLIAQQVCLKVRGTEDARIVLGQTPELPLPTESGQAILGLPTGQVAGQIDYLSLDDFAAVCERAVRLRSEEPAPPLMPLDGNEEVDVDTPVVDPFAQLVTELLADGPLEPTELRRELPEEMRCTSPKALAARLAQVPGVRPGRADGRRVYRLDPSLRTPGTVVGGVIHAQQGAPAIEVSSAGGMP